MNDKADLLKIAKWAYVFLFLLIAVPTGLYIYNFGYYLSDKRDDWSAFSDFMALFVGVANLIVTAGIGWAIYSLQRSDSKEKEVTLETRLKENRLRSFYKQIESVIKFLNNTIDATNNYIEILNDKPVSPPVFTRFSLADLTILVEKTDRSQLYIDYIELVKSDDGAYVIFSALDAIYENSKNHVRIIEMMLERRSKALARNTEYIQGLRDELTILEIVLRGKLSYDSLELADIMSVTNDLDSLFGIANGDYNMTSDFVEKEILTFLNSDDRFLRSDFSALINRCHQVRRSVSEIESILDDYASSISQVRDYLVDDRDALQLATIDIKSYVNFLEAHSAVN